MYFHQAIKKIQDQKKRLLNVQKQNFVVLCTNPDGKKPFFDGFISEFQNICYHLLFKDQILNFVYHILFLVVRWPSKFL